MPLKYALKVLSVNNVVHAFISVPLLMLVNAHYMLTVFTGIKCHHMASQHSVNVYIRQALAGQ